MARKRLGTPIGHTFGCQSAKKWSRRDHIACQFTGGLKRISRNVVPEAQLIGRGTLPPFQSSLPGLASLGDGFPALKRRAIVRCPSGTLDTFPP